jgi:hypothetical protein
MTDWRGSPPHIDLLAVFVRPRDVSQVLNWQYLPDSIKESPTDAVTRFINEGLLVDCLSGSTTEREGESARKEDSAKQRHVIISPIVYLPPPAVPVSPKVLAGLRQRL